MQFNYDRDTRVMTLTMSVKEDEIFRRARRDQSPDVVVNVVETWLRQQEVAFSGRDTMVIKEALKTATVEQLDSIKTMLGV